MWDAQNPLRMLSIVACACNPHAEWSSRRTALGAYGVASESYLANSRPMRPMSQRRLPCGLHTHRHTSSSTYMKTYTQKFSHPFLHAIHTNRFQHRMEDFLEEKIKCRVSFYLLPPMMRGKWLIAQSSHQVHWPALVDQQDKTICSLFTYGFQDGIIKVVGD